MPKRRIRIGKYCNVCKMNIGTDNPNSKCDRCLRDGVSKNGS